MTITKQRVTAIFEGLKETHPDAHCALNYKTPFELIVSVVLSAQCTDEMVNKTTPGLFAAYPTAEKLAKAPLEKVEVLIMQTGFYRNKAKNIVGLAQALVSDHSGKVPDTLDELVKLPGVGRKTANVVLGECYGVPGITVDTHCNRLSRRIGLTKETDPEKIEQELMKILPDAWWTEFSHLLIWHGRKVCPARKPDCDACKIRPHCEVGTGTPDPHVPGKRKSGKAA